MATSPALMTMEQYLHTSYRPDVHFVDGEIEERNVGEKDHGRLQNMIGAWFDAREIELSLDIITEMRMRTSATRVRICDVAVFRSTAPDEQVATVPPVICVEVKSPEDRLSRVLKVLEDYLKMGISNIWLIDPQERLAYTFGKDGLRQQQDLMLRAEEIPVVLDVNELFLRLDRKKASGSN